MSFKRFDQEDITISADSIITPAWSGQITNLTSFVTSSTQASTNRFYFDIYQTLPGTQGASVQFSLAYGNRQGSGSENIASGIDGISPSSIIYGQYRTLINGDENTDFIFGDKTPNSIYVISVNRGKYKERILPGTMTLRLGSGSSDVISLTDNSKYLSTQTFTDSGRVYDLITGSNGEIATSALNVEGFTDGSGSYGKLLPDIGVILLNGDALKATPANGGLSTVINEGSATSIVGSPNLRLGYDMIVSGSSFRLQSEETITSNFIFIRVRNSENNYSTNPTNLTADGELIHNVMVNSPQAYITTVGLYNDDNELLAIAKLSRPLLKDFTKEALIRIKLDY